MKYPSLLSFFLTCLLIAGQSSAGVESMMLSSSRSVTPVKLIPVITSGSYGVRLEHGLPCLAEGGNRLRKLVHNFGKKDFVLVQYKIPYATTEGQCPNGTLFFLPEAEATEKPR